MLDMISMHEDEEMLVSRDSCGTMDSREDADWNVNQYRDGSEITQKENKNTGYKHNHTGFINSHSSKASRKLPSVALHRIFRPLLRSFSDQEENLNPKHFRSFHKTGRKKYVFQKNVKQNRSTKFRWHKNLKNHFENSSFEQNEELDQLLSNSEVNMLATNRAKLCQRYLHKAQVLQQAKQYDNAVISAEKALKILQMEVEADSDQLADIYQMCASIRDEKMTLMEYMYPSQIPEILVLIQTYEKCIKLRRQQDGLHNMTHLGSALNRLSFYYSGVSMRGGSQEISETFGQSQAMQHINESIDIFKKLNDDKNVANCLITKGVIYGAACVEQLNAYKEAEEMLLRGTGELHPFVERLYHNMGIHYEESHQLQLSYDYMCRWYTVCRDLYGPKHCKTLRPISTLNERQYKSIAMERGIQVPTLQHQS